MGKSSLLARLNYKLKTEPDYDEPIVVKVTGNTLLGLGDFREKDQAYLENYWKQIICKKIIIEIGTTIGVISLYAHKCNNFGRKVGAVPILRNVIG
jgi:hypothetical protein